MAKCRGERRAKRATGPDRRSHARRHDRVDARRRGLAADHPAVVGARRHPLRRLAMEDRVREERDVRERQHRDHPRQAQRRARLACGVSTSLVGAVIVSGGVRPRPAGDLVERAEPPAAVGCRASVRGCDAACSCRTAPASGTTSQSNRRQRISSRASAARLHGRKGIGAWSHGTAESRDSGFRGYGVGTGSGVSGR